MWLCAFFFSTQHVLCHWVLTLPICSVSRKPGGSIYLISWIQSKLLRNGYNIKIKSLRQKKLKFWVNMWNWTAHRSFSWFFLTCVHESFQLFWQLKIEVVSQSLARGCLLQCHFNISICIHNLNLTYFDISTSISCTWEAKHCNIRHFMSLHSFTSHRNVYSHLLVPCSLGNYILTWQKSANLSYYSHFKIKNWESHNVTGPYNTYHGNKNVCQGKKSAEYDLVSKNYFNSIHIFIYSLIFLLHRHTGLIKSWWCFMLF